MTLLCAAVDQILLMRRFGGTVIEAEVVPASRFEALMTKDFLDVPDRAAIEQKLGCSCMPEQMGRDALIQTGKRSMPREWSPDIWPFKAPKPVVCGEQSCMLIVSRVQVTADPMQRTLGEEDHSFLAALPDDLGFGVLEVDL